MFNKLEKTNGNLDKQKSKEKDFVYFSKSTGRLKIVVSINNLRQYKKFPWDKFVKKKDCFVKHFPERKILVYFLELSMFINVYFPYTYYWMK